jgi:hypothetical protein
MEKLAFFVVLGLELRVFTLSHSTALFVMGVFHIGSLNYLPGLLLISAS